MSAAGLVLAIDPGVRGCGVALFEHNFLIRAAYIKNLPFKCEARAAEAADMAGEIRFEFPNIIRLNVIIEWPQIYAGAIRAGKSKVDPNDLLALTAVAGAIAARYNGSNILTVRPREWKGQMTKAVTEYRILDRLEGSEIDVLTLAKREAGSFAHNIVDAVGIGLCYVGRWSLKWRK